MTAIEQHLVELRTALSALGGESRRLERWASLIAPRLLGGARLLAVGNGGSAAHAQHLTAELVGRYDREREPLSAIALHADTSTVTALVNDYGVEEMFSRQVRAHGRAGDVLVCFSTSGRSPNVVAATHAARDLGLTTLAVTGRRANPLADAADDALCVAGPTPTVQEVHQVVVHLLCECIDSLILDGAPMIDLRDAARSRAVIAGESA